MTDAILKKIDDIKYGADRDVLYKKNLVLREALRVAVAGLDEIESLAKIETAAIQLRIWDMQERIANILGIKHE